MRLLSLAIISLLAGCATQSVPANRAIPVSPERLFNYQEIPSEPFQYLVINRDKGFSGSSCDAAIYIDGQLSVRLKPEESAIFKLPLGDYALSVDAGDCGKDQLQASVLSTAAARFRIAFDSKAQASIQPTEAGLNRLCSIGMCGQSPGTPVPWWLY